MSDGSERPGAGSGSGPRSEGDDGTDTGSGADADDGTESDEGEREWRFGLDEVGPDAEEPEPAGRPKEPIEPESVSTENAAFVLAGALGTLLLFWLLAMP